MKNIHIIIPIVALVIGIAAGYLLSRSSITQEHKGGSESTDMTTESNAGDIWTCSMHPQIRQEEFGICPICEMDLIPLGNTMGSDDPTILQMSENASKLAQIETYLVGGLAVDGKQDENSPDNPVHVDGTVELDQRTVKSQTAHLSGRIETMAVSFEGQYISAGQKIARLYSTDLLAASQELITANQYNDRVEGLKDAAIQKLKNWKITDRQIQEIISTNKPIETVTIYADHSGYVISKRASQGDYVKQGSPLYTLGSTTEVWLLFNVFESDIAQVDKGNSVSFTTSSIPNQIFTSTISFIEPVLNSNTRTATVRAEIRNPNNKLKPGMLLDGEIERSVKISIDNEPNSNLNIPNSAILWTGKRSVVYVQLPDTEVPTFQYREITVVSRSNDQSIISDGVSIGEKVVTHGAFAIDAAAQLNNNLSMMNKNVSIKKTVDSDIVPSYISDTPETFKSQLDIALISYLALKDAFVNTDPSSASLEASFLLESILNIDMNLLSGEAHIYWMEQYEALTENIEKIKNSTDVEKQRRQFDFLSQVMIKSIKAFGTDAKTYYVQYCPMANGNTGADWISAEDEIRNPYFGDKMMKCGSVKLELK